MRLFDDDTPSDACPKWYTLERMVVQISYCPGRAGDAITTSLNLQRGESVEKRTVEEIIEHLLRNSDSIDDLTIAYTIKESPSEEYDLIVDTTCTNYFTTVGILDFAKTVFRDGDMIAEPTE